MDRELLKRYMEDGFSARQIATLSQLPVAEVCGLVERYRLGGGSEAQAMQRRGLTREELEPLVEAGRTMHEMAETLRVSQSTVQYWLKKHGLRTKNAVGRRPRVKGRKLRVTTAMCRRHGESDFVLDGRGSYRCKRCRAENVARRRRRVKQILVEEAGGCCVLCGYARSLAALEFHHLDPSTKSFGLAARGVTRAIEQVREEARKCLLVCSNCHAEIECGDREVPLELCAAVAAD